MGVGCELPLVGSCCLESWVFPPRGMGEAAIAEGAGAAVMGALKLDPALLRTPQPGVEALAARLNGVVYRSLSGLSPDRLASTLAAKTSAEAWPNWSIKVLDGVSAWRFCTTREKPPADPRAGTIEKACSSSWSLVSWSGADQDSSPELSHWPKLAKISALWPEPTR